MAERYPALRHHPPAGFGGQAPRRCCCCDHLVSGALRELRADTHADNKIMQHLLEKNGFTKCGIIHVEDGTPRIAYQKMSLTLPLRRD